MMTMMQRVARAICVAAGLDPDRKFKSSDYSERTDPQEFAWHEFQPEARAALAAMREPAGVDAALADEMGGNELCFPANAKVVGDVRRKMVDAFLAEPRTT